MDFWKTWNCYKTVVNMVVWYFLFCRLFVLRNTASCTSQSPTLVRLEEQVSGRTLCNLLCNNKVLQQAMDLLVYHHLFFSECIGVQVEDESLLCVCTWTAEGMIQCRGLGSNWKPLLVLFVLPGARFLAEGGIYAQFEAVLEMMGCGS